MKDIQVIGNSYSQGSYQLLMNSYDRVRATLYFSNLCSENAQNGETKYARWYARASLSEFKSIFDVLNADLKRMGVQKIWERSQFKDALDQNTLIKILSKARNIATHTAKLPGTHKVVQVNIINGDGEEIQERSYLFFNEIDRSMFNEKAKYISDEELSWFNRQSLKWPIHLLIKEAIYQSSQPLAGFITTNRVQTKV